MNNENMVYPSGYEVYWEPWVDAYSNDDYINMQSMFTDIKELGQEDVEEELTQEEMELIKEITEQEVFNRPLQTIMTPFGVMPLTDNTLASKRFKFWTAHTNFKIHQYHVDILDNQCEGVESFDLLTPLRS